MNLKDLDNYEVEEASESEQPLNLSDLEDDYEVVNLADLEDYEVEEDAELPDPSFSAAQSYGLAQDAKKAKLSEKISDLGSEISGSKLGKAAGNITRKVATEFPILGKMGRYSNPEDMKKISDNLDKFNLHKEEPGTAGQKLAESIEKAEGESYVLTKNLDKSIDVDEFNPKSEDFLDDVKTRVSREAIESNKSKKAKQFDQTKKTITDTERRLKRLEVNQDKKLTELQNKKQEYDTLAKEYKSNKPKLEDARKMSNAERQAIDSQLDDLKLKKRKLEKDIIEYTKAGGSREAILDMRDEIKDIDIETDRLTAQKRKLSENMQKMISDAKDERVKSLKLSEKYNDKKLEVDDSIKKLKKDGKDNLKVLQDKLKKAKDLKKTLMYEDVPSTAEKAYKDLETLLSRAEGEKLTGEQLQNIRLYFKNNYDYNNPVYRAIVDEIKTGSPTSRDMLNAASAKIVNTEELKKLTPVVERRLKDPETGKMEKRLTLAEDSRNKLAKIQESLKGGELASEKQFLEDVLKKLDRGDVLEELDYMRLAKLSERKSSIIDTFMSLISPAAAKRVASDISTFGQETVAKIMGTPLGKGLGKLGKGTLKALPLVGAGFDIAEAKEMGLEGLELAAYVAGEQINPLPVSSGDIYKMAKEAEKSEEGKAILDSTGLGGMLDVVDSPVFQAGREGLRSLLSGEGLKVSDKTKKDLESYVKGLDTKLPKDLNTYIKDINNSEALSNQLRGVNEEYANRIDSIKATSENKDEYERKISMLNSEPAFRELVRRQMRRMKNEQGDRD